MKKLFPIKAYILFTIIMIASAAVSYCVCAQAECAKELLDLALGMNGTKTTLIKLIFVTSALLTAELFRKLLTIEYERVITNTLQEKFMKGILSTSFRKFKAHNQDTYMSMFNNELRSIISDYYMEMLDFLFSILSVLFYSAFLIRLQPIIAIIIIISNIFPIIVPGLFAHVLQKKKSFYLQAMQKCNIRFGDGIKGWSLLKLHGRGGVYKKIFERAGEEATRKKACYQTWNAFCEIVIGFFSYTSYLCIIVGGIWLIYRGSLTAGGLLASITVSEAMVSPIINLAYQANTIQATRQIRREIFGEYIWTEFIEKSVCF